MNGAWDNAAAALPADLAAQVLMLIDQKQRMKSCALVNHNWNKAAKLTISNLTCRLGEAAQYQALSSWLCRNSSHIYSIKVCSKLHNYWVDTRKLPTLQLPVCELQQLHTLVLEYCHLQPITTAVAPGDSGIIPATRASLAALTALKTLKLKNCVVYTDDVGDCTSLQHLLLRPALPTNDCIISAATVDEGALLHLEGSFALALGQLQQLTSLSLNKSRQETTNPMQFGMLVKALSNLQQLQVLEVGSCIDMPAYCFADLPLSLRKLKISSFRFESTAALPIEAAPRLQRLSNLQHLHLEFMQVENPQLLLSCTQLTGLDLTGVKLKEGTDEIEKEAMIQLLAVLQKLQQSKQLHHLGLICTLQFELYDHEPYAALTASSHLTYLDLVDCCIDGAAVRHIFAAAQPCRGLITAKLTSCLFEYPGSYWLLVNCCPALQYLDICYPGGHVGETDLQGISALQALTDLTTLWFGGQQLSDDVMASIAQCQQLKDLEFWVSEVSLEGLQHLTRLTGLTRLLFRELDSIEPEEIDLTNQAAAGCAPDVHQQLKSHLEQQEQQQQQRQAAPLGASSR